MKIMLAAFNAKYIHSNLAVYDLKAYAQKYASNVILKEYTINQQKDDILRDIYLEQPDVVCVSCYIWNITFVKELMRDLAVAEGEHEVTAVVTTAAGNNNMSPEYLTRAIRQYLPQYEIPFSEYHRMNVFTADGTPFR